MSAPGRLVETAQHRLNIHHCIHVAVIQIRGVIKVKNGSAAVFAV